MRSDDRGPIEMERQKVGLVVEVRPNSLDAEVEAPLLHGATNPVGLGHEILDELLDRADFPDRSGADVLAPDGGVEKVQLHLIRRDQLLCEAFGVLAHTREWGEQGGAVEGDLNVSCLAVPSWSMIANGRAGRFGLGTAFSGPAGLVAGAEARLPVDRPVMRRPDGER